MPLTSSHLKRTVEVSGEFDQLLLHRLADGAAVTVQGHAVHQQKAEEREQSVSVTAARSRGAAETQRVITSVFQVDSLKNTLKLYLNHYDNTYANVAL